MRVFALIIVGMTLTSRVAAQDSLALSSPALLGQPPATVAPQQSTTSRRAVTWHRALGTTALASFGTALAIGAASGNLGKLMDETQCCPDGGTRNSTWRTTDRILVDVGIASYLGAATIASYRAITHKSLTTGHRKNVHRALAMVHGALFVTSAVTGAMMSGAQGTDPKKFARLARIHVASNVLFVPVLAMAFTVMTVR